MYLILCSSVVESHLQKDKQCGRVFSVKRVFIKSIVPSTDHQLPVHTEYLTIFFIEKLKFRQFMVTQHVPSSKCYFSVVIVGSGSAKLKAGKRKTIVK